MEIVVNDTNIMIDLYNAGLLPYCKEVNLVFHTLDVIIEEIIPLDQREAIQEIINEGTLKVCSLTGEQIVKVYQKLIEYEGICNLTFQDISIMLYAKEHNCRLLTGDKKLKEKATLENVKVSGILYITDMMAKVIDKEEMMLALQRLMATNNRLPKKLIVERINELNR